MPTTLRLLTINIHKGFSLFNRRLVLHELRDAIRATAADVVCLQEVQGEHSGHGQRHRHWPAAPQYEFLADSIWSEHAYGRNAVYTKGHHGNAVLSKFAIRRHRNHDVSIAGPEQRGLLHCELALAGQDATLHVICLHLSLTEGHRQQQLLRLCELIERDVPAAAPLLVAGDFNDWRQRATGVLTSRAGLVEVHFKQLGSSAKTFPARLPLLPLDRIYSRNVIAAAPLPLPRRPWSHLSDHVPLAVEVTL